MAGVSALIRGGGRVGGGNLAVLTFVLVLRCARPERPAPAGRDRTVVLRSHTSRIGTRALDLHGHLDAAGGVRARGSGYRGSGARRTRRAATDIRGGLLDCPVGRPRARRVIGAPGASTARGRPRRGRPPPWRRTGRNRGSVAAGRRVTSPSAGERRRPATAAQARSRRSPAEPAPASGPRRSSRPGRRAPAGAAGGADDLVATRRLDPEVAPHDGRRGPSTVSSDAS